MTVKKVRFWGCGGEEIINFPLLTEEEVEKEFKEWIIEKADAGWEIISEDDKLNENYAVVAEYTPGDTHFEEEYC